MTTGAYTQVITKSKNEKYRAVFVLYIVASVVIGLGLWFSVLAYIKVQYLEARITELEQSLSAIQISYHKNNEQSMMRPPPLQDDSIYTDYEDDYPDMSTPEEYESGDVPYRFTLGKVLVESKAELARDLEKLRSKRDILDSLETSTTQDLVDESTEDGGGLNDIEHIQDQPATTTSIDTTSKQRRESTTMKKRRRRHKGLDNSSVVAVHFSGDTSKYIYGKHSNFKGNGHLKHPKKVYVDWKQNDWPEIESYIRHEIIRRTTDNFSMRHGVLRINQSGLFFLYAQIYFLDKHDTNGFKVVKNSESTLLQCVTTSPSHDSRIEEKGNTCYTAGAEYLVQGDEITIMDLADNRYSKFEPGNSFFGVIKLM